MALIVTSSAPQSKKDVKPKATGWAPLKFLRTTINKIFNLNKSDAISKLPPDLVACDICKYLGVRTLIEVGRVSKGFNGIITSQFQGKLKAAREVAELLHKHDTIQAALNGYGSDARVQICLYDSDDD
jgi:hypothetical protein